MFELEKTFFFEAGHILKHHDGKCKDPHGHSYQLHVILRSPTLVSSGPKTNMIMDFYDITGVVKEMIEEYFDHKWLNDTLNTDSPTSEFMCQWIFKHLEPKLPGLFQITIYETASSKASYIKP